ncbi:MAG: hypothetical protein M1840_006618 [Geoglossum simile]|nr:MAG: hypothetical protein M1840_006618 [Geoglossum simile]
MARSKANFGQDWVTKHLPQLQKEWAERKAKQLTLAAGYKANRANMDEEMERAIQEERRRMILLGAHGPRALLPVQTTAETSSNNSDNAEQSTTGSFSKPRIRNRIMAPAAPPENGWAERLRRTRADKDDNEDEDGRTDSDESDDGEEGIERTTKRYRINSSGGINDSFGGSRGGNVNTGFDMVYGRDNWSNVSETSSKSNQNREVGIANTTSESDSEDGEIVAAARLMEGFLGHVHEKEIEDTIKINDNKGNVPPAEANLMEGTPKRRRNGGEHEIRSIGKNGKEPAARGAKIVEPPKRQRSRPHRTLLPLSATGKGNRRGVVSHAVAAVPKRISKGDIVNSNAAKTSHLISFAEGGACGKTEQASKKALIVKFSVDAKKLSAILRGDVLEKEPPLPAVAVKRKRGQECVAPRLNYGCDQHLYKEDGVPLAKRERGWRLLSALPEGAKGCKAVATSNTGAPSIAAPPKRKRGRVTKNPHPLSIVIGPVENHKEAIPAVLTSVVNGGEDTKVPGRSLPQQDVQLLPPVEKKRKREDDEGNKGIAAGNKLEEAPAAYQVAEPAGKRIRKLTAKAAEALLGRVGRTVARTLGN